MPHGCRKQSVQTTGTTVRGHLFLIGCGLRRFDLISGVGGLGSQRPDCVAGVVGLEVRRETGKE